MADPDELIKHFGIILPAVEEMMSEQGLSCEQAIAAVWMFMSEVLDGAVPPPEICDAVDRLSAVRDEPAFRFALNRECLRALGMPYDHLPE